MIAFLLMTAQASPLADAVVGGRVSEVRRLLRNGAAPDEEVTRTSSRRSGFFGLGRVRTTSYQTTPLLLALPRALGGDRRILQALLDGGASPDARPEGQPGALWRVVRADEPGRVEVADLLLDHGASWQVDGGTVGRASSGGRADVFRVLLEHGATPDALVCDVHDAGELGAVLAFDADPSAACAQRPPLHRAVVAGDAERVSALLVAGADVHRVGVSDAGPGTALHVASSQGHLAIVEQLLEAGAEVDVRIGPFGRSALQVATPEVGARLLEAGARRTFPGGGAWMWSSPPGEGEVAAYLLAVARDDEVPLHGDYAAVLAERRSAWAEKVKALGTGPFLQVGALSAREVRAALDLRRQPTCVLGYHPSLGDVRDMLGAPESVERDGITRVWTFDGGAVASGYRWGLRKRVMELHGACDQGTGRAVGLARGVLWLLLGVPESTSDARDVWRHQRLLALVEEGRVTEVGGIFR